MEKKTTMRDWGVELARIIGCLIVIGVHINLSATENGGYNPSRGLISCFLADGVAIFWLITGCFLFRNASYKKVLLRTAKTIAFPLAIYSVFSLFFSEHIANGGPLIQCTYTSFTDYFQGFKDALSLKQTVPFSGHLWYCYTYILIMVAFPVLKAFVLWLEEERKREFGFCLISFALLVINDLMRNRSFAFSHHGLNAAVPAAVIIIWGAILYRNKELLLKHKFTWAASAACFIILNVIRMFIIWKTGRTPMLFWFSSVGLLCGICVVVFSLAVGDAWKNKKLVRAFVLWLAKHTFFIYLIHMLIISLLKFYNIPADLFSFLSRYTHGFLLESLYVVALVLLIFSICLIVSVIFGLPSFLIKRITASCHADIDTVKK